MHCFKFAVPTDDGIGWLITSGDDKSTGKFFLLLTPMAESAAFKPSKRPALEAGLMSARQWQNDCLHLPDLKILEPVSQF